MSKLVKFVSKLVIALLAVGALGSTVPAAAAQSGDLTVTIHYARQSSDFTGRYAWIWYTGTNASGTFGGSGVEKYGSGAWVPVDNAGIDSYGAVSNFTLKGALNIDSFGIIECSTNSWTDNCGRDLASSTDRFIKVTGQNTEVWLRSGSSSVADTTIYTSESLASGQSGALTVTVHYARQNADFTGRYAWVWYTGTNASGTFGGSEVIKSGSGAWVPVANAGIDSYGAISTFTLTGARHIDSFGIIECSTNSWTNKCGRDLASSNERFINVTGPNTEVWLRSGSGSAADTTIYTSDSLAPNPSSTQKVRIHYNRTDGNYAGWKLYLGTESKVMPASFWVSPKTYDFDATNPTGYTVGSDQFGAYVDTTLPYYAGQAKTLNMIVYSLATDGVTWTKDGGNVDGHRYLAVDPAGTTNAWLVSGDTTGNAAFATDPGNISGTPTPTPTPTDIVTPTPTPTDTASPTPTPTDPGTANPPVISGLSAISATEGDLVVVSGTDLQVGVDAPTVSIGGVPAEVISSDQSSVTFMVPAGLSAGTVQVTVTTIGGTSNAYDLEITAGVSAPSLSAVTDLQDNPITAVQAGDQVKLVGTNLAGATSVSFSGVEADLTLAGTVITDTSITVTVPESISGSVSVTTPAGASTGLPLTFLNVKAPTIDLVDPAGAVEGDQVAIAGSYLLGATVTIGGETATVVQASSSLVIVTMPYLTSPGTVSIVVTTEGGSASGFIDALASPAPVITDINPAAGAPGDLITVTGKYFVPQTGLSFCVRFEQAWANVVSATTTSFTFEVPAGLTPGEQTLFVSSTTGGTSIPFTVLDGPAPTETPTPTDSPTPTDTPNPDSPTVTLVDPQGVQPGDVITIIGQHFGNNPTVTISGQQATVIDCGTFVKNPDNTSEPDFNNCDGRTILVIVPEGLSLGAAEIQIAWDNQTSAISSVAIVSEPPTIDGLDDQSGKVGDVVTIRGTYLSDITNISFDGNGVASPVSVDLTDANYVVASDGSSVTVTVPAGATTGTITITTLSGSVTSDDVYEVIQGPTIDSFSAASGIPGDLLTIFGSNLASVLSVSFNGTEADLTDFNVEVADDGTSIKVVVPDDFTSGPITVTTTGGTATSADVFSLAGAPAITAVSPLMGRIGSVITITGTNLSGLQSVSFDGDGDTDPVLADLSDPLTKQTDSLVQVVVPTGASSGTITLTVSGGVVTSEDVFEVVSAPSVTSLSDTSLTPGQTLVIRGTDLTWAKVRIRGVLAAVQGNSTDTTLRITVPQVAPGKTTLVITTPGGVITKSVTIATPAPTIKSVTQSASKKRGVGTVVVIGKNLNGAVVKVGNVTAKVRAGATSSRLVFTLPKKAAVTSKGVITITTDGGTVKSKATLKVTAK